MNARRKLIAALSEDSMGGIATLADVEHAEQLVDAYRAEVITNTVSRLRAIPVTCTALTGPVWYGTGWKECITALEDIADYHRPDDEAYPGELQRLRVLALQLRVAVLRKEDLADAQRLLVSHAEHEAQARSEGAKPDFFQPGRTYIRPHHGETITFVVQAVSTSPDGRTTVAHGWRRTPYTDGGWETTDSDDFTGWTEAGEGR